MEREDKILIVGYGSVGRRHARNLWQLGYRNLFFLRSGRAESIDEPPPKGEVVFNLSQALAHEPIAAVIATPSALHLEAALPLAEQGCHLFIEKPLAADCDLKRCEELVRIARDRKLVTMIGYQFRFHPLLRELREGLENKRLGEIIAARAEWGEYLPAWHPWEDYRTSYAARADLGGGVLLTLIHPINYLSWLFGEVVDVQGACRKIPLLSTSVPDDWANLTLHFPSGIDGQSGIVGQVHLDYIQDPPVHQLSVWGDRGHALLDFHAGTLSWVIRDEQTQQVCVSQEFTRNDLFLSEMRHFLDALVSHQATDIPIEVGVKDLRIVARARPDMQSRHIQDSEVSRDRDKTP